MTDDYKQLQVLETVPCYALSFQEHISKGLCFAQPLVAPDLVVIKYKVLYIR